MTFQILNNASRFIDRLRCRWQMMAPPQRLVIVSAVMGALFTLGLAAVLSERDPAPETVSSPWDVGLVADRSFDPRTPIQLIYFSFKKIPDAFRAVCARPVTLAHSEDIQNAPLVNGVSKGAFLCWSDIGARDRSAPLEIRKGHRVMGFQVSNPEILAHIETGARVDAMIGHLSQTPLTLEDVRVVDLIFQNNQPFILLEINKKQLDLRVESATLHTSAKIVLRNQSDSQRPPSTIRKNNPMIRSG